MILGSNYIRHLLAADRHLGESDGLPGYVCIETVTFEDLGGRRTKVVNTSQ